MQSLRSQTGHEHVPGTFFPRFFPRLFSEAMKRMVVCPSKVLPLTSVPYKVHSFECQAHQDSLPFSTPHQAAMNRYANG